MKLLRFILLITLSMGWVTQLQAQVANEVTWNLLREESGVKIYYAIGSCDGQNKLWLKVDNTTSTGIVAHVDLEINQSGQEITIAQCHLDASANQLVLFDCAKQSPHVIVVPVIVNDLASFSCSISNLQLSIITD